MAKKKTINLFKDSGYTIIRGQDHLYWVYSESRDQYFCTGIHWRYMSEEDLIARANLEGFEEIVWVDELGI